MAAPSNLRLMNVVIRPGTHADDLYGRRVKAAASLLEGSVTAQAGQPAMNMHSFGGRTLPDLAWKMHYLGGRKAWAASDVASVDRALGALMRDSGMNNVIQQYFSTPVTSTQVTSAFPRGHAPAVVDKPFVESLVGRLAKAKTASSIDFSKTIMCLALPQGVVLVDGTAASSKSAADAARGGVGGAAGVMKPGVINLDDDADADSKHGLGGYHGSVHVGGMTVYYAVGVYSEIDSSGQENGIAAFDQPWKNIVATFYHELTEARTDPDVEDAIRDGTAAGNRFLGWYSIKGGEIGDIPISTASSLSDVFVEIALADGSGTVPTQLMWSNAVGGPSGPLTTPPPLATAKAPAKTKAAAR